MMHALFIDPSRPTRAAQSQENEAGRGRLFRGALMNTLAHHQLTVSSYTVVCRRQGSQEGETPQESLG